MQRRRATEETNMIQRLTSNVVLLGLALVSFAACGDDDDDDTGATGGSAARGGSTSGGAQAGGTGGANTSGGSAARGGSGGTAGKVGTGGASGGSGGKASTGGTSTIGGGGSDTEGGSGAEGGEGPQGGGGGQGGAQGGAGAITGGGAGGGGGAAGEAGAGGAGPAASLSDAQIILVIDTLNAGEVEVAFAALPRLTEPAVEAFAEQMITAHGAAREANSQLAQATNITPAPSQLQLDLKAMADAQVLAFQTSPAPALDAPYIDSQVMMHTDALTLANQLFAAADNAQLRAEIAGLIPAITAHLNEAQAIQATLE
jgi:predicted outer membrane protein